MKKWIASWLVNLLRFEYFIEQYSGNITVNVFLGETTILLLRAYFDGNIWRIERYR